MRLNLSSLLSLKCLQHLYFCWLDKLYIFLTCQQWTITDGGQIDPNKACYPKTSKRKVTALSATNLYRVNPAANHVLLKPLDNCDRIEAIAPNDTSKLKVTKNGTSNYLLANERETKIAMRSYETKRHHQSFTITKNGDILQTEFYDGLSPSAFFLQQVRLSKQG